MRPCWENTVGIADPGPEKHTNTREMLGQACEMDAQSSGLVTVWVKDRVQC